MEKLGMSHGWFDLPAGGRAWWWLDSLWWEDGKLQTRLGVVRRGVNGFVWVYLDDLAHAHDPTQDLGALVQSAVVKKMNW